ncbi:FAD binding domain-containing protein [Rhodoplanes azumiensis]|uniref:FAD binding domain-containing protein n=1 Tax=Rhodoplanes azumiensis TaxID=1897628 RepID=A0ABW5AIA4_9BRAD
MKPAPFVHHVPRTLDEAIAMLADVADQDGRILAGGQSLVPAMALRLARPAHLVDINAVPELAGLATRDGALVVGACVRHAAFHEPVEPGPLGALLADVVRHIAHWPIRTRGTMGGSLANADPASEWCLVAETLGAEVELVSLRGGRRLGASDFNRGTMETALAADELLAFVHLPLLPEGTRFGFCEVSRRAGDYAQAMALVVFEQTDGIMRNLRVGVGAVEGKPRRIAEVEAVLEGAPPDPELFRRAGAVAAAHIAPAELDEDVAAYKRHLAGVVVERALVRAIAGDKAAAEPASAEPR